MQKYIWQKTKWPHFTWNEKELSKLLGQVRLQQGRLLQKMNLIVGDDLDRSRVVILEQETLKTALIEGEKYDPRAVRSSIHSRLNLPLAGLPRPSRQIDGLIDVILDAVGHASILLKKSKLFAWHATLFPTGYSQLYKIRAGKFRDDHNGPMQVVSGNIGREKIYYQAPPSTRLQYEMSEFLNWWNHKHKGLDGIIRAGVAHFYFVTIHPFDDGNGRLARIITDMALAEDDGAPYRYYSLSSEIIKRKVEYYRILEKCQKSSPDLTDWLVWFLETFLLSLKSSDILLGDIFAKTSFWYKNQHYTLSIRQKKVINKIMDAGKSAFSVGITTRQYMIINHSISRSTAIREIQELVKLRLLLPNKSRGRSTSYRLSW